MKKIMFLVLALSFSSVCLAEDFTATLIEQKTKLEKIQQKDAQYLQQIEQEKNNVTARYIARGGAITNLDEMIKEQNEKVNLSVNAN